MLSGLSCEQFINGIKTFCLAHKEIYPNTNIIAYIREYALTDINQKTAEEAWGEIIAEIKRVGYYGQPNFSTHIIKKSVECIGWYDICFSEEIGIERAHFLKAYKNLIEKEKIKNILNL